MRLSYAVLVRKTLRIAALALTLGTAASALTGCVVVTGDSAPSSSTSPAAVVASPVSSPPTPTPTPTPTAPALPTEWIGRGTSATTDYGALPDVIYLSWTDANGNLTGQVQYLKENTGQGVPVVTELATLTGTEAAGNVTISVAGDNTVGPFTGTATGTISPTTLTLNGDALVRYDDFALNGVITATVTFQPGSSAQLAHDSALLAAAARNG